MCEYYFTLPSSHIAGLHYELFDIELFCQFVIMLFSSALLHLIFIIVHFYNYLHLSQYFSSMCENFTFLSLLALSSA